MLGQNQESERSSGKPPSPAVGLVFALGCFGFFYSLIAAVDPLL